MTDKLLALALIALLGSGILITSPMTYASTDGEQEEQQENEEQAQESKDDPEPEEPEQPEQPEPDDPEPEEPVEPIIPDPEPELPPSDGIVDPEPTGKSAVEPLPPYILPPCDGTFQDCVTPEGNICNAGQGGHECECAEDFSDCPNHPSRPSPLDNQTSPSPSIVEVGTGDNSTNPDPVPCTPNNMTCPNPEPEPCVPNGNFTCPKPPKNNNTGGGDTDIDIDVRNVFKNINIKTTDVHNHEGFPDVDIIGLSIKATGDAQVCMMEISNGWVQCQEFAVPDDRISNGVWRIIETDHSKDYDDGNTGSNRVDDTISMLTSFEFKDIEEQNNHDFGADLAAVGINPLGEGLTCMIDDPAGTALCEPFKVEDAAIDGQITEITEIDAEK